MDQYLQSYWFTIVFQKK